MAKNRGLKTDSFQLEFQVKFTQQSGEIFTQARVQVISPTGGFMFPPHEPMIFNLSPVNGQWLFSSKLVLKDLMIVARNWLNIRYPAGKQREGKEAKAS